MKRHETIRRIGTNRITCRACVLRPGPPAYQPWVAKWSDKCRRRWLQRRKDRKNGSVWKGRDLDSGWWDREIMPGTCGDPRDSAVFPHIIDLRAGNTCLLPAGRWECGCLHVCVFVCVCPLARTCFVEAQSGATNTHRVHFHLNFSSRFKKWTCWPKKNLFLILITCWNISTFFCTWLFRQFCSAWSELQTYG